MKIVNLKIKFISTVFLLLCVVNTYGESSNLNQLLESVEKATVSENKVHQQRLREFQSNKAKQQSSVTRTLNEKNRQEKISEELEDTFDENEAIINAKQEQLQNRLGSLTELFGHLSASAADLESEVEYSVISAQYPNREAFLSDFIEKLSQSNDLPSIAEIETLWFEMQREMTASGTVEQFESPIVSVDGSQKSQQVLRIGAFNLITEGQYLAFNQNSIAPLSVLKTQPGESFLGNPITDDALNLQQAKEGYHPFVIDPTGPVGGEYLQAIIESPSVIERWKQGGVVGLVITCLAVYAVVLAVIRLFAMAGINKKVSRQLQNTEVNEDNPLGRVLQVYENNKALDLENLEYKLAEAILQERPLIEKGVSSLKIVAMIAPLLGLLGTVIGMIMTFQSITLFGAGDPQTMAGGISQALVTTVLGLCVAVPAVILHAVLAYSSKQILSILEKQSIGFIAEKAEKMQA